MKSGIMKGGIMKGGIMIDTTDHDAFIHFISNSTFYFLSSGSFGLVFVAQLNEGIESKYRFLNAKNFNEPVRKLIIKIGFIYDNINKNETMEKIPLRNNFIQHTFREIDIGSFKNEVNIQTDIYLKTMNYLEPVCPAIVYANNINNYNSPHINMTKFIDIVVNSFTNITSEQEISNKQVKQLNEYDKGYLIFMKMRELMNDDKFSNLGVIAMEFADSYRTLPKINYDILYEVMEKQTLTHKQGDAQMKFNETIILFLLIRLAIETGYSQADFHNGNILLDVDNDLYFSNIKGAPLLIDFGLAVKIPLDVLDEIKELYKNEDYFPILQKLCNVKRADGLILLQDKILYSWVCGMKKTKPNITKTNNDLSMLFKAYDSGIDNIIQIFNKKHELEPNVYPLLPLSNSIKNKLYEGMIEPVPNENITLEITETEPQIEQKPEPTIIRTPSGNLKPQSAGRKTKKYRKKIQKKTKKYRKK